MKYQLAEFSDLFNKIFSIDLGHYDRKLLLVEPTPIWKIFHSLDLECQPWKFNEKFSNKTSSV